MKKIIKGRKYDTETATEMGHYSNEYPRNDFKWYEETLYKKRTGEFFLHGNGNAASPYTESCGDNSWTGSEKIIPLRYEDAQEWAEKKLDAEDYEKIFGEVSEDETKVQTLLRLSPEIADFIKRESVDRRMSASEYIERLVKKEMK